MQHQPRYGFMRRLLLPYSGEEPLTPGQGRRVILTWTTFFPLLLSLASLPIELALMGTVVWQKVLLFFLLTLLAGIVIFGCMAWFIVIMMNRAARFYQQQRKQTSGGRYGS